MNMADGVDIDLYADVDHEFAQDDSNYTSNNAGGNVDLYDDMLQPSSRTNMNGTSSRSHSTNGSMQYNYQGKKVSIYIGNLTWWTTDQDVQDAISSLGVNDLIEIKFYENRANGQSKGFAVVHLTTETSSRIVMEKLPSKEIHGQNPVVTPCNRHSLNQFEQQSKAQSGGSAQTAKAPATQPFQVFTPQQQSVASSIPPPTSVAVSTPMMLPPPRGLLPMPPPYTSSSIPPPGVPLMLSGRAPPPMPPGLMPPPGVRPAGPPPLGMPPPRMVMTRGPPTMPRLVMPPSSSPFPMRLPPPGLPPPGMPGMPPPGMLPMPTALPPTVDSSTDYRNSTRSQSPPMTEVEVEEHMNRNRAVSSSAISRAVADASAGDYGSAIETLVTAISLIKQSKVVSDERSKVLLGSLQDCLHGIEEKSFGRSKRDRSRDREERSRHRESKSRRRDRDRDRSRSRDRYDERDYRERSRERDSSYSRHSDRDRDRHRR